MFSEIKLDNLPLDTSTCVSKNSRRAVKKKGCCCNRTPFNDCCRCKCVRMFTCVHESQSTLYDYLVARIGHCISHTLVKNIMPDGTGGIYDS